MAKLLGGSHIYGNLVVDAGITAGNVTVSNTTVSLSTTTGALVVAGGIGVAGNIFATKLYADGIYLTDGTPISSNKILSGASNVLVTSAYANVAINSSNVASFGSDRVRLLRDTRIYGETVLDSGLYVGNIYVANAIPSANHTSGALVVNGGVGIEGNIHMMSGYQLHIGDDIIANTFVNSIVQIASNVDSYQQVLIQNLSTGASASSDFVAVTDDGDDSNNYIAMGINNSLYSSLAYNIGGPRDGYLYVNGGDLAIGTQTAGKVVKFHSGGTQSANLRMTIADTVITVEPTTISDSPSTGALVVKGGMGVEGDMHVGGTLHVTNLQSSSTQILTVREPLLYLQGNTSYPYDYDIGFYSHYRGGPANAYVHTGLIRNDGDYKWYLFSNVPEPGGAQVNVGSANALWDTLVLGNIEIKNPGPVAILNAGTSGVGNIGSPTGVWDWGFFVNVEGTISTASQPNITSLGTLTSLNVTGTADIGTTVTAGNLTTTGTIASSRSVDATNQISALELTGLPSATNSNIGLIQVGAPLTFVDTNIIGSFTHDVNSYAQMILQNKNSGTTASADYIVNNDLVGGQAVYGDYGINSSGFTDNGTLFNTPTSVYLYCSGGNLNLGTTGANWLRLGTNNNTDILISPTGEVNVNVSTQSTTTTSGALTVLGGVGVGGNVFIGGNLNVASGQINSGGLTENQKARSVNFVLDGGGVVLATGSKVYAWMPANATIIGWTVLADQSGTANIDIKKATYADFPTTTSIAGISWPGLSAAQKNQDLDLTTGWGNTTIIAGDIIEANVVTASTVTRITVSLKLLAT